MTNHMHLLVTPERAESLPRTMQLLGRRYARAINAAQRRNGTLWEGRCRAAPIDSEAYFLACCRYIGINRSKSDGLHQKPRCRRDRCGWFDGTCKTTFENWSVDKLTRFGSAAPNQLRNIAISLVIRTASR